MKDALIVVCALLVGSSLVAGGESPTNACSFPEGEYLTLQLSAAQLQEIDGRRRFTLSKAQLARLRTLAPSFPKRIGVASPFVSQIPDSRFSLWPDQITGIWFCRDKVAIRRDAAGGMAVCREFNSTLNDTDAVLIGVTGDYWIGPRRTSREKLVKCLDKLAGKEPEGASFSVFLLRPPMLLSAEEERVVQDAVNEVVALCRERELDCRIGG